MFTEKRALQIAVCVACTVPITGGGLGVVLGSAMLPGPVGTVSMDSQLRYLSGLLVGIGFMFLACVPGIERRRSAFSLLTFIVVLGGLARLVGVVLEGAPGPVMTGALVMELVVTPALWLWQRRIST